MRFAITGSTGMIGSSIIKQLVGEGHEVIAMVRKNSSRLHNIPKSKNIRIIECSLSDYKKNIGLEKCDYFIHLAWEETLGEKRDDVSLQINNIDNTIDAVVLAQSWGAKKFIGAGSQAEYGITDTMLSGSTPVNPESGYGIAKYCAGKMASLKCKQLNIEFNWGRIVSAYGELDSKNTLISYLIRSFKNSIPPELTKCEQTWDYIYSEDVADAFIKIALHGVDGKTYCVGGGSPRKLKEFVLATRDAINPDVDVHFGARDYYPHQPMYLSTDLTELTDDTGFKPKYTFEEGIRQTIKRIPET